MSSLKKLSDLDELKELEADLVQAYGKAVACGANLAVNLIGAALEDVGNKIEQELGVNHPASSRRVRYDN